MEKVIKYLFYLLFFTIPLIFLPWTSELFEFNKMVATYIFTILIVAAWAIRMIAEKRIIFRRTSLDFFLVGYLATQLLSYFVSIDRHTSFFGYYSRFNGGLLSSISYSLLYWAYVSNMDKEKTVKTLKLLIIATVIVSVWGILEHFGISPSCLIVTGKLNTDCWVQDVQNRVFATFGQPNWLAAWIVALSPIVWAHLINLKIKTQNPKPKFLFFYSLALLLFIALLYTKSRSGILGFVVESFIFWVFLTIYSLKSQKEFLKNIFKKLLIFNFLFLILALAIGTPWTPRLLAPRAQAIGGQASINQGSALEVGGTESGEIRKIVWRGAIEIWKHYPIFGTGPETFAYSYYQFRPVEHNLVSEWDFLYNKAHNEYLNIVANTGSFGLIGYLLLIFFSVKQILKNFNELLGDLDFLSFGVFAGYVGILVTNFFGFSVVPISLLFFLYPAMAAIEQGGERIKELKSNITTLQKTLITIILFFTLLLFYSISRYWYADVLYAKGKSENDQKVYVDAEKSLSQAIKLEPDEPLYHDEIARSYLFLDKDKESLEEINKAAVLSPRNLNIAKSRINILIELGAKNQEYLNEAAKELKRLLDLAPTDAKIYYNLGLTLARTGNTKDAIKTLEYAVAIKSNYKNARFALALLYNALGEKDKAKQEFLFILEKIDPNDELVKEKLKEIR